MPCCDKSVVLKTSSRGTRFFAHSVKKGCDWKPETEVHRTLKNMALTVALAAGWEARSEVSGADPDGNKWTADVSAVKDGRKLAVEVQWSGQTVEETRNRQRRYERSGVTGVWLFRQSGFPVEEGLPAVCIGGSPEDGLKALIPRHGYYRAQDRRDFSRWSQVLEPEDFFEGLFENRMIWGLGSLSEIAMRVETDVVDCWKCDRNTRLVTGLSGRGGPYRFDYRLELADRIPRLIPLIRSAVCGDRNIGEIRPRYSRTAGISYVSNGCSQCGALQGRFYVFRAGTSDNPDRSDWPWTTK